MDSKAAASVAVTVAVGAEATGIAAFKCSSLTRLLLLLTPSLYASHTLRAYEMKHEYGKKWCKQLS